MYTMIERYVNNMTIDDMKVFLTKKNIVLNDEELVFSFNFLKKNWYSILKNPSSLQFNRLKDFINHDALLKIELLFKEYTTKYSKFL